MANTTPTIILELTSYNLADARLALIKKCVEEANSKGGLQQLQIAEMLGCSPSTISELHNTGQIHWLKPKSLAQIKEEEAIAAATKLLQSKGYKVAKDTTDTPNTETKF